MVACGGVQIPWRKADVKYVTNEIYFDIVEQIDAIIAPTGNPVSIQVYGDIRTNCRLSGMPDLTLNFTRSNLLEDCALHRCVRINRFEVCALPLFTARSIHSPVPLGRGVACSARKSCLLCRRTDSSLCSLTGSVLPLSPPAPAPALPSLAARSVKGIQQLPISIKPTINYKAGSGRVHISVRLLHSTLTSNE
jgi:hypothetical protein